MYRVSTLNCIEWVTTLRVPSCAGFFGPSEICFGVCFTYDLFLALFFNTMRQTNEAK
jgi:hypothetical protein